jgi:hypothetical protein
MGTLTFKFKKPINYAYAPGLTKAGKNGPDGERGADGNALYFIDYELDNSYVIELTQQKIENNYMLSGESEQISNERSYHEGDIIVTNNGNCYMLVKEENSYYTYGIKYIGRISGDKQDTVIPVKKVIICRVKDRRYNDIQYGFMPNNRQFLTAPLRNNNTWYVNTNFIPEADVSEESNAFELNGAWFKFIVVIDDEDIIQEEIDNTEFIVELNFQNEKTYQVDSVGMIPNQGNTDPTTAPLYKFMKFTKSMEFPAPYVNLTTEAEIGEDYASYIDYSNTDIPMPPTFLSDMCMDKVHCSGNDLKSGIFRHEGITYCSIDGTSELRRIENDDCIKQRSSQRTGHGELLPVVYSIYPGDIENMVNYRGGESAYFSSIEDPEMVPDSIAEYIMKYAWVRVIAYNKSTGETNIYENIKAEFKEAIPYE